MATENNQAPGFSDKVCTQTKSFILYLIASKPIWTSSFIQCIFHPYYTKWTTQNNKKILKLTLYRRVNIGIIKGLFPKLAILGFTLELVSIIWVHLEPTLSVNGHNVLTWTLLSDHRNVRRLQKPKCAAKYGQHHTDVCRFAYKSIRTVARSCRRNDFDVGETTCRRNDRLPSTVENTLDQLEMEADWKRCAALLQFWWTDRY